MINNDTTQITSVWSTYGHRFISDDGEDTESCLTCGAMYRLQACQGDPTRGEYVTVYGEEPMQCTGDTSMVHGYPGEREDGPNYNCNCLLCDS
jgi:hypothetical protein